MTRATSESVFSLLVAVDPRGSAANQIAEQSADLARRIGAQVTLVTVIEPPVGVPGSSVMSTGPLQGKTVLEALTEDARKALAKLEPLFGPNVSVALEVLQGATVQAIVERGESADMVVVGTHGRGGLARFFLGSVAEGVVRRCTTPVLTIRSTVEDTHASEVQAVVSAMADG